MNKITVIGSGGWGTAIAVMLAKNNNEVTLFSVFSSEIEQLEKDRENKKLLPGIKIPENVNLTFDTDCAQGAGLLIFATPSFAVRSTAKLFSHKIKKGAVIVNLAKGLEESTYMRLSQVLKEELPQAKIAIMSGPSHAEEVARGIPTTNVICADEPQTAEYVQEIVMNPQFRVYTNTDIVGAELGGALKNVIALAAGICDGMGFGDNTKAALMTRGITEMVRLGVSMGAKAETFAGLTGVGDLIVTCTSVHSRNHRAGVLIGKGRTALQAMEEVGMTVEGYKTAAVAYALAQKYGVELPIINEIYEVLYNDKPTKQAISDLMGREKRREMEDMWV